MRKPVHLFKFSHDKRAMTEISVHLSDAIIDMACHMFEWNGVEHIYIQTIPSSLLRWLRHGFDHMFLLRLELQKILNRSMHSKCIRIAKLIGRTWKLAPKQSQLDRAGRITATNGIFCMKKSVLRSIHNTHVAVIVIDDVLTTGVTMNAALDLLATHDIPAIGLAYCHQPSPF